MIDEPASNGKEDPSRLRWNKTKRITYPFFDFWLQCVAKISGKKYHPEE